MITPALCLVLLLAQSKPGLFGKTPEQALAMGQQKWYEFYDSKAGSSTQSMILACDIYGDLAEARNSKLLATKAATVRKDWNNLAKALRGFASESFEINSMLAGGGTIWHPIAANIHPDVQELVYHLLTDKSNSGHKMVVSMVGNEFELLKVRIDKAKLESYQPGTKKTLYKNLTTMQSIFKDKILPIARGLDRHQSDLVLSFCVKSARIGNDLGGN